MLVKLSNIKIGNRFRCDLGDTDSLAKSITELGLLQPIVLTENYELVCGRRRIAASQKLGLSEIEARIIASNPPIAVRSEIAENTERESLSPEDIVRIDEFYRDKLEAEAKERQKTGKSDLRENFAKGKGRSSAKIAAIVGISDRTLEKIRVIKDASVVNPGLYSGYWEKANSNRISIDKAYRKVKQKLVCNLKLGDMKEVGNEFKDDSIDLIFTDPPYDEKSLPLYDLLAKLAQRVLKPGGSLVTFVGHYAIPNIIRRIEENSRLEYHWQLIVKHNGRTARMWKQRIWPKYKPLLWYYKTGNGNGPTMYRDIADLVESELVEKGNHEWEQSTIEARHMIEPLTMENQTVLDPFMGSGTTGIAALEMKRKFIGIEANQEHFDIASQRLAGIAQLSD